MADRATPFKESQLESTCNLVDLRHRSTELRLDMLNATEWLEPRQPLYWRPLQTRSVRRTSTPKTDQPLKTKGMEALLLVS